MDMRFGWSLLALAMATGGAPAHSATDHALVLTCHELVRGVPDPEGNQYVLDGDVLTNHVQGQQVVLSSSRLTSLTPLTDGVSTWSAHQVNGHKVHRTVFWKNAGGKTVRTFREVYDFDAQTVRDERSGQDQCHHGGK